ncbi:hypothetical protein CERSUDRAFT_120251 [Gelatoporia subvermispora B]|uniref:Uncharacterized protein n=1 Tax=Ceriporiopsis subvermispora (strain B) TaxID=914234 RepID=M2Q265_CERS8|nr:hypothetical protein CERSUDRAFT_120251 [Gelatoporia subvermispora B]
MSAKTLSNGTLSLRFMQNAQRTKQQAQVEAEQKQIKDEAEWEVSKEVKEAWGISESRTEHDVAHEASYLPFLFPSASDSAEASSSASLYQKPVAKGRRTFNHRGQEVLQNETPASNENSKATEDENAEKPRSKRLVAISGFRAPAQDSKKPKSKTAQMLIREDNPVRPPSSPSFGPGPASGFIKPAGFDDRRPSSSTTNTALKRGREDLRTDPPTSEAKKRKKKDRATS